MLTPKHPRTFHEGGWKHYWLRGRYQTRNIRLLCVRQHYQPSTIAITSHFSPLDMRLYLSSLNMFVLFSRSHTYQFVSPRFASGTWDVSTCQIVALLCLLVDLFDHWCLYPYLAQPLFTIIIIIGHFVADMFVVSKRFALLNASPLSEMPNFCHSFCYHTWPTDPFYGSQMIIFSGSRLTMPRLVV